MQPIYGLSDHLGAFLEADAAAAGERSRLLMELRDQEEARKRSVRRRLASTLVQIGVKLDPMAANDKNDDD